MRAGFTSGGGAASAAGVSDGVVWAGAALGAPGLTRRRFLREAGARRTRRRRHTGVELVNLVVLSAELQTRREQARRLMLALGAPGANAARAPSARLQL